MNNCHCDECTSGQQDEPNLEQQLEAATQRELELLALIFKLSTMIEVLLKETGAMPKPEYLEMMNKSIFTLLREHEAKILEEAANWFEKNYSKIRYWEYYVKINAHGKLRDMAEERRTK